MKKAIRQDENICLDCALCCNGALFADVKLRRKDSVEALLRAGLRITAHRSGFRLAQPCAALRRNNKCRVYPDRPRYCQEFECALLKRFNAGQIDILEARRAIRRARNCLARIESLFRKLGNRGGNLPLKKRFEEASLKLAAGSTSTRDAALYGELTLAMHELNLVLAKEFYP